MRPTPSSLGATSAGGTSRTSALLPPPSGFEVYDIGNNNITNAAFIGTVGSRSSGARMMRGSRNIGYIIVTAMGAL